MQAQPEKAERQTFGRYETLFRIAGGGMAEVYAARALGEGGFQKLVALKRMLPHLAEDERFVTMFLDEGRLAAHISSPHVVQTLDLGRAEDGSLYLVMELVRGASLANLLHNVRKEGEQLPVGIATEVIAQAAQGLDDAHNASTPLGEPLELVHRDVSPQNVLIGADGRARITDFGVARAVQRSTQTQTGELKGKFSYFAPEQVTRNDIDHRIDVFALGVIAWEAFTGRRLFAGDNPLMQLDKVKSMPIPPVDQLRPEVPHEVAAIVAKALERDRDQRVQSAAELAQQLRDAARGAGVSLPSPSELGAFVTARGGKAFDRLETKLKHAFSGGRGELPEELEPPLADRQSESHSGVVGGSWGGDLSPGTVRLDTGMLNEMDLGGGAAVAAGSAPGAATPPATPPAHPTGVPAVTGDLPAMDPSGVTGAGTPPTAPMTDAGEGKRSSWRLPVLVGVAVAVLGLGVGGWLVFGGEGEAESPEAQTAAEPPEPTEAAAAPAETETDEPQDPAEEAGDDEAQDDGAGEERAAADEEPGTGEDATEQEASGSTRRRAGADERAERREAESRAERARRVREAMLRRRRAAAQQAESSGGGSTSSGSSGSTGSGSTGSGSSGSTSSGSSGGGGKTESGSNSPGPGLVGVDAFDQDLQGD